MKIYKSRNGMLALVEPDSGHAIWVHSGEPILARVDVTDGWTEQRCVDAR